MVGPIGLVGSGEFGPASDALDRRLLDGRPPRAVIIPTAAGQEGDASVDRWIDLGMSHFDRLGVEPVPLRIVDRAGADDPAMAAQLAGAGLIYFSGGDPAHVVATMRDSLVWGAVIAAWQNGSALAGCSAGAMMMGSTTASPRGNTVIDGLGVFDRLCVLPHFDRFSSSRPDLPRRVMADVPAGTTVIGIDEDTGLLVDGGRCEVIGRQGVWHVSPETVAPWAAERSLTLAAR